MRNILINNLQQKSLEEQKVEIVERKGLGHPDSICDAIMNEVSVNLSKEYIEKFGGILHHNIDKSLLVAGETHTRLGGGVVEKPMRLIFGDRATFESEGIEIPVKEIAIKTSKTWLKENLRFIDPNKHVIHQVEIQPGSSALTDIFRRGGKILGANDTSAAVGWGPLSKTEKTVLDVEKYLNSNDFKNRFHESGEDIKVMAYRRENTLDLTVSMAFVDRFVHSEEDYFEKKTKIFNDLKKYVDRRGEFNEVNLHLNTLDTSGRGESGIFLTVLGTSADGADSGQVGRGNRVNGLISLNRPQCSEAAAGKNPVSHVGKIYNLLAHKISNEICSQIPEIRETYVWMLSKIGMPIDQPEVASIQIITDPNVNFKDVEKKAEKIVDYELENISKFCLDLAYGKYSVC